MANFSPGKSRSIPAFYEGQNSSGVPNHYESIENAIRLKSTGKARSINRGTAILIRGPRRTLPSTRDSSKSGWKVIGQTSKKPSRPGMPHYGAI